MTIEEIKLLEPDERGFIIVNSNGVYKRYVKVKLIAFLKNSIAGKNIADKFKAIQNKQKRNLKKPKKVRGPVGNHRKKPVIATGKDGIEQRFESSVAAANALGLDKNNIPHALSGKYKHVGGYKFKYAEKNSITTVKKQP